MRCAGVGNLRYPFTLLSVLFQTDDGFTSAGWKDTCLIGLEKLSANIMKKDPEKPDLLLACSLGNHHLAVMVFKDNF